MSGGVEITTYDPIYVDHDGSTAVLYYLDDTEDVHDAARRLIAEFAKDEPVVIVVDYRTASIFVMPKEKFA